MHFPDLLKYVSFFAFFPPDNSDESRNVKKKKRHHNSSPFLSDEDDVSENVEKNRIKLSSLSEHQEESLGRAVVMSGNE